MAKDVEQMSLEDLLARALRSRRGRKVLGDSSGAVPSGWGDVFSWVVMGWFAIGDGWFLADQLALPVGWKWLAAFAAVMLVALGVAALTSPQMAASCIAVGFVVSGIFQLIAGGAQALFWTHASSGLVAATAVFIVRGRALAASAPLLLPLIIVVLFLPLFTSDLWQAVSAFDAAQYAWLVLLVVVPLAAAVYRRLSHQMTRTFDVVVAQVAAIDDPALEALAVIKNAGSEESEAVKGREEELHMHLRTAFEYASVMEVGEEIRPRLMPRMRRVLVWKLATTVLGMGSLVAGYTYLLTSAAINTATAARWVGEAIPTYDVEPLGALPGGPFLKVAALFSIVAVAIFLAFALTEDEYAETVSEVLVAKPIKELLLVAVPYLAQIDQGEAPTSRSEAVGIPAG